MASKGVIDRQRVARSIVATARTHAEEVGQQLQATLGAHLPEGQSMPDMVALQLMLADHLETRIEESIAADEAHLRELRDDDDPRRRRDEAADFLYSTLSGIREAVSSAFGEEHVKALVGYVGSTPSDPLTLHRVARRALELLRQPESAIPSPRFTGMAVDLTALAEELQPALDGLTQALAEVDTELRETETTLRLKDTALDALDRAIAGAGRMLIGCNELAGRSEYGDRIRLSRPFRRRRGTTVPEAPPEGEGPEPEPTETSDAPSGAEEPAETGS